ncbi:MAG: pilus assembly protein PilM [Planctomycetota bacterium]
MFTRSTWAIDLGHSAIKGVLLRSVKDGVEILDADIMPLEGSPSKSRGEPSRHSRLWTTLRKFDDKHSFHRHPVAISIPAQNTLIREIQIALVGKRDVSELVEYEASNAIPFVLDEVFWDYHLFPAQENEKTRDGIIVAVKKTAIHTYLQAFSEIGADRIVDITLAPLADLGFIEFQIENASSALLLDIGAEHTSLVAIDEEKFWIRNLKFGGNQITWLLRDNFDIPFSQAEEAKRNIARSRMADKLVSAIKPGLHELLGKIKTNLEYIRRQNDDIQFERTFAIGGTSRLTGLKAQIKKSLGRKIADIRTLKGVFVSSDANTDLIKSNLDRLATAIGTGIQATGHGSSKASFLPESTGRLTRMSATKRFLLTAGILTWILLGVVYFFAQDYEARLRSARTETENVNELYSEQMQQMNELQNVEDLENELRWLASFGQDRSQLAALFSTLVDTFENASSETDYQFGLISAECSRSRTEEDDSPIINVTVQGKMQAGSDEEAREAYEILNTAVINQLRDTDPFAIASGTAEFTKDSPVVRGKDTKWDGQIPTGSYISAHRDGEWYRVVEVPDDNRLRLNQSFSEDTMTSNFTVADVRIEEWDHTSFSFKLNASIPAQTGPAGD